MPDNQLEPRTDNPIRITSSQSSWEVAPGSTVEIDLLLENISEQPEEISLRLTGVPSNWFSESPPFRLDAGEMREVAVGISPPDASATKLGDHNVKVRAERLNRDDELGRFEGTLTVAEVSAGERFRIFMRSRQFTVAPGGEVRIDFMLANRGLEDDTFRLKVDGIPSAWVSAPAPQLTLAAGDQQAVSLSIHPPRSPESRAGRRVFKIRAVSANTPSQSVEVQAALTISAFSDFGFAVSPSHVSEDETFEVEVENRGNLPEIFTFFLHSPDQALRFEFLPLRKGESAELISRDPDSDRPWGLRIPAGETGRLLLAPSVRQKPWFGEGVNFPFELTVQADSGLQRSTSRTVVARGIVPAWIFPAAVMTLLAAFCLFLFYLTRPPELAPVDATQTALAEGAPFLTQSAVETLSAGATQTAVQSVELTVSASQADADNDGLSYEQELQAGTDPANPDTDSDGLTDGLEIDSGWDPLNPDTDGDTLLDGQEVQLGTDPLRVDTDGDGLEDPLETPPCPDPRNPDTDGDGLIDGQDIDPCDPTNPSLTATAGLPTATPVPVPSSTPAPPAAGNIGRVVFVSDRDGNPEIYIYDSSDNSLLRLTDHAAADTQPVWAPDGSRIAFVSDRDGNPEIYIINADGSNLTNLTNHPGSDREPAWSPDGALLAFTSDRDGSADIFVMNADGSDQINFTNHPAQDSQPFWYENGVLETVSWIGFTTDRDGNREVYTVRTDGQELTNLTNHPEDDSAGAAFPSGNLVAFVSNRDGNDEIYLTSLAPGGAQGNLTEHPGADRHPVWSPDGDWILFVTDRDGNFELYLIQAVEPRATVNLSNIGASDTDPDWLAP